MKSALVVVFSALVTVSRFSAESTLQNDPILMEHWPPYYRPLVAYVWSGVPIQWVNTTASPHTVRHDDCVTGEACLFDSGSVRPGEFYTIPGLPPGRYPYHCELHPIMGGTLTVEKPVGRASLQ